MWLRIKKMIGKIEAAVRARTECKRQVFERFADIFIARTGGFFERNEVRGIIPASAAELSHLLLETCGDIRQAEYLSGKVINII